MQSCCCGIESRNLQPASSQNILAASPSQCKILATSQFLSRYTWTRLWCGTYLIFCPTFALTKFLYLEEHYSMPMVSVTKFSALTWSTYNPKSPDSSMFRWSSGGYFSSLFATLFVSFATASKFTDAASPCLRNSFRLYLSQSVSQPNNICTSLTAHVLRKFWHQPPLRSLWGSGTLSMSSNRARFSISMGCDTVSRLLSICSTHNRRACSTSSLVTTWILLDDNDVGVDASFAWSCCRPFLLKWRERDAWLKIRASSRSVAKCCTAASCEMGWFSSNQFTTRSQSWRVKFCRDDGAFENDDVLGVSFDMLLPALGPASGKGKKSLVDLVCLFIR